MQKHRTVPLGTLRRFIAATMCSISIMSLFLIHVHVSPSPTHHKFNDKIPAVCIILFFTYKISSFHCF
ncbi:hypothetical protein Lalb_Chr08g0242181 [Lupinus albus]|uniref:Uncharacterized protein n=1 Tax=Lupinus albus TaxID=3870 RepID=A0A6A4Q6K0_LUPAL|nr:hypothetical protein Lalb_Chr08g0242181 [Lupinus albus]